jgi:hypothetical protein
MSRFVRQMRRAWARDPNRPRDCTCQPCPAQGPDGSVVLRHSDWCGLRRVVIERGGSDDAVVLSVRGPGYGEPGYGRSGR